MDRKSALIPEPIVQLQRQLEQFRTTQSGRTKLPETTWQAAVELARQYGCLSSGPSVATGLYKAEEATRWASSPPTEKSNPNN